MLIGVTLRNMGPQSQPEIMRQCALSAEAAGVESIWITDHIAIPPNDAEGSGGRYTDPLTTLAWLGAKTERIKLGTGVLILPYRTALPTAKAIATTAEFTGNRLLLGVGVGWMQPEFDALGVDRRQRGADTDAQLNFLRTCFHAPVASANGQQFLFDPRPALPPLYIGGSAPQALARAIRHDAGWLPMARSADRLAPQIVQFEDMAQRQGVVRGPVTAMAQIDCHDAGAGAERVNAFAAIGVERLVCVLRYDSLDVYLTRLHELTQALDRL